jgi:hypothetical protein
MQFIENNDKPEFKNILYVTITKIRMFIDSYKGDPCI